MVSPRLLLTLLRETFGKSENERIPEPRLIMSDSEYAQAFDQSGEANGHMASIHLFICGEISQSLTGSKRVLDLGCGSGQLLLRVAKLNPHIQFVGIDLSEAMLSMAERNLAASELSNVQFVQQDMTNLSDFQDGSFDGVISSLALHHLEKVEALSQCFAEIKRVLKPDGVICLSDLSLLKQKASIEFFASLASNEHPCFVQDYLHSMRAAFPSKDFKKTADQAGFKNAQFKVTKGIKMFMQMKSHAPNGHRIPLSPYQVGLLESQFASLSSENQKNFKDILNLFGLTLDRWLQRKNRSEKKRTLMSEIIQGATEDLTWIEDPASSLKKYNGTRDQRRSF